jgi:CRP/FNR family transcriptional regulator, cyclic AMP receptor protein
MRATEIVAGERSTTPAPRRAYVGPLERRQPLVDGSGPEDAGGFLRLAARLADVTVKVPAGAWDPSEATSARGFTTIIVDGLLVSELCLGGEPTAQLLLPGETLDPLPRTDRVLSSERMTWRALEDARVAVLGGRFLGATQRFPQLTAALCRQQAAQIDRAMRYAAVTKLSRVEERIIAFFCAVAEERGRVAGGGVLVELPVTHELLGRLIGARRPTVSLALKTLAGDGLLTHNGTQWLLSRHLTALDEPPASRSPALRLATEAAPGLAPRSVAEPDPGVRGVGTASTTALGAA